MIRHDLDTPTDHQVERPVDGRIARADATRRRLVEAMSALISEGEFHPRAAQVAARAGVSVRSVFQHFHDLESLTLAAGRNAAEACTDILREAWSVPAADLPLETRLDAFVERRCRLWDAVSALRRAALLWALREREADAQRHQERMTLREEIERCFSPELNQLPREARAETLEALVGIADWPFWHGLRQIEQLSVQRAERAMRRALRALLLAAVQTSSGRTARAED